MTPTSLTPNRRRRRRALALTLLGLLTLATPARAEDAAALLARAPAVAADGPVTPLAAPVEIATIGWGPFRRLCVAQVMLRPDDGAEVETAPPSCFSVERAELRGRGPDIGMTVQREATGRFGPVTVTPPAGVPEAPPDQMARLATIMRAALQAHGMQRATILPATRFTIPLPLGAVDPDLRVEGGGFACDPEGEARLRGRRVVLASCAARAGGEISPGRAMTIAIAGRFAIDVETGMVLRHGYASFLVLDADPRGSMARLEMRGASRQSLE
jgi:hypothetical protein